MLKIRRLSMKKIVVASAMMASVAMANDMESRPEASVPTPVERHAAIDNVPKLSEKENVDWLRLREERRAAREQILQNLRENTAAEKNAVRNAQESAPAVPEKFTGKNEEMPKDDFAREQKREQQDENQWMKMQAPPPFVGPMNKFNPRRGKDWNQGRPFDPRRTEKIKKGDWPKREDFEKGNSSR